MTTYPAQLSYDLRGQRHGSTVDLVGMDSLLDYELDDGEELAGLSEGTVLSAVQLTYMRSTGPDLFPLQGSAFHIPAARIVESTWTEAGRKRVRLEQLEKAP